MLSISNGVLTAKINEHGAELSGLSLGGHEYIYDNPAVWDGHAPVLFPFVGRLYGKRYVHAGKTYENVPLHGFASKADYTVTEQTGSSLTLELVKTEEMEKVYPFAFSFSVRFTLEKNTLAVTYFVKNEGAGTMYYALGSHPAFSVPLESGLAFEDFYAEFPCAAGLVRHELSPSGLMAGGKQACREAEGNRINLRHGLFWNDALVLSGTGGEAVIASEKTARRVTVAYPGTDYCLLWQKYRNDALYLCIEPWTSLPGNEGETTCLETKGDYKTLAAGESREHRLMITVQDA